MIRIVLFLLGCALMALATIWPNFWHSDGRGWTGDIAIFRLGLLLAVASHGWPEGLR